MNKKVSVLFGSAVAAVVVVMAAVTAVLFAPITTSADNSTTKRETETVYIGGAEPLECTEETEYAGPDLSVYSERSEFADDSTAAAGESAEFFDKCVGQKWGYFEIGKRSNGAKRQKLYDKLFSTMIRVWNSDVDLTDVKQKEDGYNYELAKITYTDLALTKDEVRETFFAFYLDNPVFYFMSKTYSIVDLKYDSGRTGNALKIFTYKQFLMGKDRKACQDAIKKYINNAQSEYKANDSVSANIRRFHNKVMRDLTYDKDAGPVLYGDYCHCAHNILGGIMYGKGVCESYSKIYQLLLNYYGFDSVYVMGKVANNGKAENHVWNIVRFDDGNYYCIDVTWDDSNGNENNFGKGTMEFYSTHKAQSAGLDSDNQFFYSLPDIQTRNFQSTAKKHTHTMAAWKVYRAATCTSEGLETRKCSSCSHYEYRSIKAEGHKYADNIVAPTCTAQGYTEHKCTVCGSSYKDAYVNATNHTFTDTVKQPTCTEDGWTEHKCSVCGLVTRDNIKKATGHTIVDTVIAPTCTQYGYTQHKCSGCGLTTRDNETAPVGHRFRETSSTPASCTVDGKKVFTCDGCHATYEKIIKAEGHKYQTTTVAPTATTDGYTEHICSACSDSYRDQQIPAGGGNYVLTQTEQPTCVRDGKNVYTCAENGKSYTQILKAKGHTFTETVHAPTCTEKGYTEHKCSVCGEKYSDCEMPANGHHYVEKKVAPTVTSVGYTEHTCTECNDSYKDNEVPKIASTALGSVKVIAETAVSVNGVKAEIFDSKGEKFTDGICDSTGALVSAKVLTNGSYKITLSMADFAPRTEAFTVKDGSASLGQLKLCRYGDMNGDGKIDTADIAMLQQLISEWNVKPVYEETADMNGNGKYDNEELAQLQQYVSGWNVKLGKK